MKHRNPASKRGGKNGFTLVETAVTVAIMSVVAGIAAQNLAPGMPVHRLKEVQWTTLATLNRVRMQAIQEGRTTHFALRDDRRHLEIWVDRNGDGVRDDGEVSVAQLSVHDRYEIGGNLTAGTFNARGEFFAGDDRSATWVVYNSSEPERRYVFIAPSGQVVPLDRL